MKPIGREFMRATQPKNCSVPPQEQGAPQPPLELPIPEGAALIALPAASELPEVTLDLRTAIERRQTVRRYLRQPLTQEELSLLLWLTQGIRQEISRPATLRNVPSAGARHAFETYLLANQVSELAPGLYRYAASQHALLDLAAPADIADQVSAACLNQQHITNSAVTFLWVAVSGRMTWRYVERGYRYLHLDAGHVCQNLYLAAEALDCGACAIAAFDDEALNQALGLDGDDLFVIYLASLGKKAARR